MKPKQRRATQTSSAPKKPNLPQRPQSRRYRRNNIDVEIVEARNRVTLKLDGKPVHVSVIDGKLHCQLAHQFRSFESIDEVVDTLIANQGRTWTLHGHVCDERCAVGGQHAHSHSGGGEHHH